MILLSIITDSERRKINDYLYLMSKGDERAFENLFSLVGGRLMSVAIGLMRNVQLAEDVVQDGLIKIVNSIHTYTISTNGYAWMCKIIRNTALNKIKYEKLRQGEDIDGIFDLCDGRDLYSDTLYAKEIKDALKHLSSKERTLIWLKYYNDMTVREIAEELKMSKSTVQDAIKSSERKLKEILETPYKNRT